MSTAAVLTPNEDAVFGAVWALVSSYFGDAGAAMVFKGFQNLTATPLGSYVVVSPGVKERQNQLVRTYDAVNGWQIITRHTNYSYQVDCYGPDGPDNADVIAIAWRSLWSCDHSDTAIFTPLYADEPQQLNIVNGELKYEQRFMLKLYAQVNQSVKLTQDFFDEAHIDQLIIADNLSA